MSLLFRGQHKYLERKTPHVPQGDDDKLCILRPVLDVVRYDGDVAEVQRSIDLVHEIEWGGLMGGSIRMRGEWIIQAR